MELTLKELEERIAANEERMTAIEENLKQAMHEDEQMKSEMEAFQNETLGTLGKLIEAIEDLEKKL